MTRYRLLLTMTILCAALLAQDPQPTSAEDKRFGIPKSEARRRLSRVRKMAKDMHQLQKKLDARCLNCEGLGFFPIYEDVKDPATGASRKVFKGHKNCETCGGTSYVFHQDAFMAYFWEKKSPMFRADSERRDAALKESRRLAKEHKLPAFLSLEDVRKTEMVSATHAISWARTKQATKAPFRWIYVKDGKKWKWWIFDETTDGTFGQPLPGADLPAGKRPEEDPGWMAGRALPKLEAEALMVLLLSALEKHEVRVLRRQGRTLHAYLEPTDTSTDVEIGADALAATRRFFGTDKTHEALHCTWLGPWRNRFGEVESRPRLTSAFTRALARRVVWENLTAQEQLDLLDWTVHQYEGWKPWPRANAPTEGATPTPDSKRDGPIVMRWVNYKSNKMPARGEYAHGAEITPTAVQGRGEGFKSTAMHFPVQEGKSSLATIGGGEILEVRLHWECAQASASHYGLVGSATAHVTIEHTGDPNRARRAFAGDNRLVCDGKDLRGAGTPYGSTRPTARGHRLEVEFYIHPNDAERVLKSKDLRILWGDGVMTDVGVEFIFDRTNLLALADVWSRCVPK